MRICRLALYHRYPKYVTDGFDALYSRPPVIYLSAAARPGLGHYLCLQVTHAHHHCNKNSDNNNDDDHNLFGQFGALYEKHHQHFIIQVVLWEKMDFYKLCLKSMMEFAFWIFFEE